jgi:hypothetical protein
VSIKSAFKRSSCSPNPSKKPALQRFLDSMKIGYYEWHDGIGYDLDALNEMSPDELKQVEELMISQRDRDWREVETLAALNTPSTIQALKDDLESNNFDVRLFAVKYLKEMGIEDHIEEIVVKTLPLTKIGDGMSYALRLAETYPTESIRRTVLRCALVGNDDIRIHCAAMALFLYGKTSSSFDVNQKIVFEFRVPDRNARMVPFTELCRMVGVDPLEILS